MKVTIQDVKDMINGGMITNKYDLETHCECWGFSPWDIQVLKVYLLTNK